MHSKSENREIMINEETDEVTEGYFKSLKNRFQNNFESMKGSDFVFDDVHLLYYKYVDDKKQLLEITVIIQKNIKVLWIAYII